MWFGLTALTTMLAGCGGEEPHDPGAGPAPTPAPVVTTPAPPRACGEAEAQALFARHNCLVCHGHSVFANLGGGLDLGSPELAARLVDRPSAHGGSACREFKLIDPLTPDASLLLALTSADGFAALSASGCERLPMPQTGIFMPASDAACLTDFVTRAARETPLPPPAPPAPEFAPANAGAALAKAKYLLHGGAMTAAELDRLGGSQAAVDPARLRAVVSGWESSAEYQAKLRNFFSLALLQELDPNTDFNEQFNSVRGTSYPVNGPLFKQNVAEMMPRTALAIVQADGDFRQVTHSRRYQVTTALLVALVYADIPQQTAGRGYRSGSADPDKLRAFEHLTDADYHDWRGITLSQGDTPAMYENTAALADRLRALPAGGSLALRTPRVGFFSTPAFYDRWATNDDNDFRITTQQTLIGALGAIFNPGDATAHGSEAAIPADHVERGTTCFQCHRHLDPMRLAFKNFQVSRHRGKAPDTSLRPHFSFMGVSKAFNSVDEFGRILAAHPQFAPAWVQKLCYWGNGGACAESDAEFQRLAADFASSGYRFKRLLREFISSPLFTGGANTDSPGFQLTLTRANHLCHALQTRIDALKLANQTTGEINVCGTTGMFSILEPDAVARAKVAWQQNVEPGVFESKGLDYRCGQLANSMFASDTSRVINVRDGVERALDQLTGQLLGLPANHHRYAQARAGLAEVVAMARNRSACPAEPAQLGEAVSCGYGLNETQALRAAFFAACTAPDVIALGL